MIGEYLYGLNAAEIASAPVIQRRLLFSASTQAAINITHVTPPIPGDKVFLCTHVAVSGSGGVPGQVVNELNVDIVDEAGVQIGQVFRYKTVTPTDTEGFQMMTDFMLFPGERLRGLGNWSAGAVNNTLRLTMLGYFLPRGTLQIR